MTRFRFGAGALLLAFGVGLSAAGQGTLAAAPLTFGMVSLLPAILGTAGH